MFVGSYNPLDIVLLDLRRYRDLLNRTIEQLEAIQEHTRKNTMVVTGAPNAAAPAMPTWQVMKIGDEPHYESVFLPETPTS